MRRERRTFGPGGRLGTLAALVPRGARVADIGSGHGLLARWLVLDGTASFCIATERTAARARHVRVVPAGHPLAGAVEIRSGDGLAPLGAADRLDTLVLAGMGSRTIRRILADARLEAIAPRRLVLQPQTEPAALRGWLRERGLGIVDERMAGERGRRYVALAAEPGAAPPTHPAFTPSELDLIGPLLLARRDPLLRGWWRARLERLETIAARDRGAAGGAGESAEQVRLARRVLAELEPGPDRIG